MNIYSEICMIMRKIDKENGLTISSRGFNGAGKSGGTSPGSLSLILTSSCK